MSIGTQPEAATGTAARCVELTKVYGTGDARSRRSTASRCDSRPAGSPRSWARPAPGSPRCCTAWRGSTRRPAGQVVHRRRRPHHLTEKKLTLLRRERIGFVFQAYNLVPTLTAAENITLPLDIAGREPDQAWIDTVVDTVGLDRPAASTARPSCPAASSSAWPPRGRWRAGRRSCSPTSPPGTSTRRPSGELLGFLRQAVGEFGQTIVMVTHDPTAAGFSDRVVFLADGRIVDEMRRAHRRHACSTG